MNQKAFHRSRQHHYGNKYSLSISGLHILHRRVNEACSDCILQYTYFKGTKSCGNKKNPEGIVKLFTPLSPHFTLHCGVFRRIIDFFIISLGFNRWYQNNILKLGEIQLIFPLTLLGLGLFRKYQDWGGAHCAPPPWNHTYNIARTMKLGQPSQSDKILMHTHFGSAK